MKTHKAKAPSDNEETGIAWVNKQKKGIGTLDDDVQGVYDREANINHTTFISPIELDIFKHVYAALLVNNVGDIADRDQWERIAEAAFYAAEALRCHVRVFHNLEPFSYDELEFAKFYRSCLSTMPAKSDPDDTAACALELAKASYGKFKELVRERRKFMSEI